MASSLTMAWLRQNRLNSNVITSQGGPSPEAAQPDSSPYIQHSSTTQQSSVVPLVGCGLLHASRDRAPHRLTMQIGTARLMGCTALFFAAHASIACSSSTISFLSA